MALFGSFKIAPGVRMSLSPRGVRAHVGPRAARLHVGGGRTGVSTGAGPFTLYESVGGRTSRPSRAAKTTSNKPASSGLTPAQAEKQRQIAECQARWQSFDNQHRVEFEAATQPGPVAIEPLPMFAVLLTDAERHHLKGVGLFDRDGRRAARERARDQAEAEAVTLMVEAEQRRADEDAALQAGWQALQAGDPAAIRAALSNALRAAGAPGAVEAVSGNRAVIRLDVAGSEAVPTHAPGYTAAGNPTLKKLTKTELASAVKELAAACLLVGAKSVFAASPTTAVVELAACLNGRPVLRTELTREALARARWSDTAWEILWIADPATEVNLKGRTAELAPL